MFDEISEFLSAYGWYLFGACIICAILYNKKLKPLLDDFREYRFNREYAAKYHKDPDVFSTHMNAQQRWAEKMQEKYNKEAEEHRKKMEEKEERKRQELKEKYENSSSLGYTLGSNNDDNSKRTLRSDYNPLMGSASGSSYRPPRRSPCGGGGCGR